MRGLNAPFRLPAPYFYSDISIGLIGVLLGAQPNTPLDNSALDGWLALLRERILDPLRLTDTFLYPADATPPQAKRLASGYEPALTLASVSSGRVRDVQVTAQGTSYTTAPVVIQGGGGAGAQAVAEVDGEGQPHQGRGRGRRVRGPAGSRVQRRIAAAGGDRQRHRRRGARGRDPHPQGGRLILAAEPAHGVGPGRDARARARAAQLGPVTVANGGVVFVPALDGGEGMSTPSPCWWPPALPPTTPCPSGRRPGALNSTVPGLVALSDVALGRFGGGDRLARLWLALGFLVAIQPYACQDDAVCANQSGLAWDVTRADNGIPTIVSRERRSSRFSSEGPACPVARPPGWWCSSTR